MGAEGRLLPRDRRPPENGRGPLGELLHTRRRAAGETMRTVGERCGLASGYLSFVERGVVVAPHEANVALLARGYGVGEPEIVAAIREARALQASGRAVSPRIRISRDLHEQALADAIRYQQALIRALEKKDGDNTEKIAKCRDAITRYNQAQSAMRRQA